MSARLLLRIAAGVFLLGAVGHTLGFLTFLPPTAEGQAVFTAMNAVHFTIGSTTYSYGNFYRGFGLAITVSQLFSAWLLWMTAQWSIEAPKPVRAIAWALCTVQIVSVGLALVYFSAPPAVLSALAAILLAIAASRLKQNA